MIVLTKLMVNFFFHSPDQIYHVTVMPCFDKKLKASREDFYQDLYRTRDVDCVITSGECARMRMCAIVCLVYCVCVGGCRRS